MKKGEKTQLFMMTFGKVNKFTKIPLSQLNAVQPVSQPPSH